jgi:hypothetical protein
LKKILHIIIVSASLLVGVADSHSQEQTISVTNYLTEDYRDYPFTKISLKLPDGYAFSPIDNGFRNEKTKSVIRIEEVSSPVLTVADGFLRRFDVTTAIDSFGFTLREKMSVMLNNKYSGFLVGLSAEVDGDDYNHVWLFIGDESRTYVIKAMTPEENGEGEIRTLRAAVLSVFYDPARIMPGQDPTTTSSSSCKCNEKK